MTQLLVLYHKPADAAAFDRYYFEKHVPIAQKIPGLRSYVVNAGAPSLVAGGPLPHLVAQLEFDSMAQLQNAMSSAEGRAATADLNNFAQAGVTVLAFDTRNV